MGFASDFALRFVSWNSFRPGWSALVAGTHLDRDIRRERSLSRRSGSHVECRDRAAAAEARDISLGAFVQSVLGDQRRLQ